jgi:oxygen-independent coproporphyrinogen-3 oxidase
VRTGTVLLASDEALVGAYRRTVEVLEENGLGRYEISNFCRSGMESRHNLKYWTDRPYEGFGLGAHGYACGERRSNTDDLDAYLRAVENGTDPVREREPWNPIRRIEEALFMGLRLRSGIDPGELGDRYGIDLWQAYLPVWQGGEEAGLLTREGGRILLTEEGVVRSNEVFREIIGHLKGMES